MNRAALWLAFAALAVLLAVALGAVAEWLGVSRDAASLVRVCVGVLFGMYGARLIALKTARAQR